MSLLNKSMTTAIALILMLTLSAGMTVMAQVNTYNAAPTMGSNGLWNYPTFPGLTVAPNPVGVGQTVQVIMIIELLPPSIGRECSTVVYGGWQGFVLSATDPTGHTSTMGPYETTPSGTCQIAYTPTMVGNYTFQFTFPGQTVNGTGYGNYYGNFLASTSKTVSLTVQQAPISGYSEAPVPLPGQYWSEPVNGQNRAWNTICGPWLQVDYNSTDLGEGSNIGPFNPYTNAPQSAHVLWTKSMYPTNGGIIGGTYGSLEYQRSYGFSPICVMAGYIYYNGPVVVLPNGTVASYFYCMNLQTGQVVWGQPGSITCGQILDWRSQQSKIEVPYLWSIAGGSYKMYSANTGQLLDQWSGTNVLSGTVVLEQPNPTVIGETVSGGEGGGALLVYTYGYNAGAATGWLTCWNSTLALGQYQMVSATDIYGTGYSYTGENPQTWTLPSASTVLNWTLGIQWNVTVPLTSTTAALGGSTAASWSMFGADGNYVLLRTARSYPNYTGTNFQTMAAIRVDNIPAIVAGQPLITQPATFAWIENVTLPGYDQTSASGGPSLRNGGNIILDDNSLECLWDFSEYTGALLWTCYPYQNDFSMESVGAWTVAYGMLYDVGFDGYMHAINTTTGTQQWCSISQLGGLEMPEEAYTWAFLTVAGNDVFACTLKAYETEPLYRGHCLYAYNAQTGAQLWNISGQYTGGPYVVADGILVGLNAYDGEVYAFNSGPTTTTVTAPMTTVTAGSSCIIEGTVTDQTPGTLQGTPAISDQWMTPWMEYKFMDQPYPSSATGVPVSIDAVDPNGNYIHIGNATSDITGAFSYQWTPPGIPGKYTIIATFAGSNAYYSSSGETACVISQPAAATPAPQYPVPYDYTMTILAGVIAIIIAIAIVGVLILRKKP